MNLNAMGSEQAAVAAVIDPDVLTAAAHSSGYVDMADFESVLAIVMAGTLGSGATLDAKLQQATDSSGTGVKDITGAAITQLTQAGSDSDKQATIGCRAEDLDIANGFRFVKLVITVATASSDGAGLILGMNGHSLPASDNDASTVDEVVNV